MPATPPRVSFPYEEALTELRRIAVEADVLQALAGALLRFVDENAEKVSVDDVPLVRETRRDLEHARLVLEGLSRRHRITLTSETPRKK